jgi:hypothetical protein
VKDILQKALRQLKNALEDMEKRYKVMYYIVGGILSNLYAVFRLTQDIDFVIDIQSQNITLKEYFTILQNYDFIPVQNWDKAETLAKESNLLQYFDKNQRVKFDNYIIDRNSQSPYSRLGPIGLKRRMREKLFGITFWVASKEDYILSKLVFGGWQDYSDALGCWMRFSESLDLNYLTSTSKELNVLLQFNLLKSGITDPDEYFAKLNHQN